MVILRTERLTILATPQAFSAKKLRQTGNLKRFIAQLDDQSSDATFEKSLLAQESIQCLLFRTSDLKEIGVVTSEWSCASGACNIGYSVHNPFRGQGFATEAVRAVIDWLLACPDVKAVLSETFADWTASQRVMEKVGLTRVEAHVGPEIVRYALAREGTEVDLAESNSLNLRPFTYSKGHHLQYLLNWQIHRYHEVVPLFVLGMVAFTNLDKAWFPIALFAWLGLVSYLIFRLMGWWQRSAPEAVVQFRNSGLFHAARDGFGNTIPWRTYSFYRCRRGGLELWNGQSWYWIPQEAFPETTVARATEYLESKGVKRA